jgi:hypothetical protein
LATTNQDIYLEGRASISETHGAVQWKLNRSCNA